MDAQLFLSRATPMPELCQPVKNRSFVKPMFGLWTSTYDPTSGASAWVEWCLQENFGDIHLLRWFLLTPRDNARILTVDTVADMAALYDRYADTSLGLPALSAIDFEAMARDYDGMRVTTAGQWATRNTYPRNLYGWDCESTCWFRWCFTDVQEIPVRTLV